MRIGVLCCFYGCEDMLYKVILPWLNLKENLTKTDVQIAVVHGLFKENKENGEINNDSGTLGLLQGGGWHDFLYVQPEGVYESEAEIRDKGLQYLLKQDCDYIILLDGDEVYREEEIVNALDFAYSEPLISWFNIEFKNLTFDENKYTKGFSPPRIFKVNSGEYKLNNMYWDNDVSYVDGRMNQVDYKNLSSKKIPVSLCNPEHYTWLNNERSRKKIAYQEAHFKQGAGCSFKWGENGLEWNEDYFTKTGQEKPELHTI
jgi:hypothetical protein